MEDSLEPVKEHYVGCFLSEDVSHRRSDAKKQMMVAPRQQELRWRKVVLTLLKSSPFILDFFSLEVSQNFRMSLSDAPIENSCSKYEI